MSFTYIREDERLIKSIKHFCKDVALSW